MTDGTQQLPDSAREALLKIADELRRGFTGTISLACSSGGVARVDKTESWQPAKKAT